MEYFQLDLKPAAFHLLKERLEADRFRKNRKVHCIFILWYMWASKLGEVCLKITERLLKHLVESLRFDSFSDESCKEDEVRPPVIIFRVCRDELLRKPAFGLLWCLCSEMMVGWGNISFLWREREAHPSFTYNRFTAWQRWQNGLLDGLLCLKDTRIHLNNCKWW